MTAEEIKLYVGRRLATRRKELGLSLAAAGARCGVSLQQIHKYETWQSAVSAPMLITLARCLGVRPGYFFDDLPEESEPPPVSVSPISS